MTETFEAAAKQAGLDLIDVSDKRAADMQTWNDVLGQVPDSTTAKVSAGFITKFSENAKFEMTIDVQAPPEEQAVLRTWAIEILPGDGQTEYYNTIQLTFDADNAQVSGLVAKGGAISRDDIRHLLQAPTTKLARINISDETGGNGTKQTHGQRYESTADELKQNLSKADEINEALHTVLQKFKNSLT
jgi:hypothetical protein